MFQQVVVHIQNKVRLYRSSPEKVTRFFKTGVGSYAEHDQFIGVSVPDIRRIAKEHQDEPLNVLQSLLASPVNEDRLLALIILVNRFKKADTQKQQEEIYQFYIQHLNAVNNWNLVDSSAHYIVGAYLNNKEKSLLWTLAASENLWLRRIAIIATWYFIREGFLDHTFALAVVLMNDKEDLMHKAVGWMLREAGKKDMQALRTFLQEYAGKMPRTMLRYALEKCTHTEKEWFLKQPRRVN